MVSLLLSINQHICHDARYFGKVQKVPIPVFKWVLNEKCVNGDRFQGQVVMSQSR